MAALSIGAASAFLFSSATLPAESKSAASTGIFPVTSCDTIECLRTHILGGEGAVVSATDCKQLEGHLDAQDIKHDIKQNLGPICRLLVARRSSSKRAVSPCLDEDGPYPDFDLSLEDKYSLPIQGVIVSAEALKRRHLSIPQPGHWNSSTNFGTYVSTRGFSINGQRGEIAVDFCVTSGPRRYVPYYYALTIDDQIVDEGSVNKPPNVPILRQIAKFKGDNDVGAYVLLDLNRDGKEDIAVLRRRGMSHSYYPAVCLYNASGDDCVALSDNGAIAVEDTSGKFLLSQDKGGLVVTEIETSGKPLGEWKFRLVGTELKPAPDPK